MLELAKLIIDLDVNALGSSGADASLFYIFEIFMNGLERIRLLPLQDKVVSVEKALQLIQDGDVVGLSGFGGR